MGRKKICRFVGTSVRPSVLPFVSPSICHNFFFLGGYAVFGLTAPAQVIMTYLQRVISMPKSPKIQLSIPISSKAVLHKVVVTFQMDKNVAMDYRKKKRIWTWNMKMEYGSK